MKKFECKKTKTIKGIVVENIASLMYPVFSRKLGFDVMTDSQTIEYILEHHASVARYGDGEFNIMRGGKEGYQDANTELVDKLKKTMNSKCEDLLICLPRGLIHVNKEYTKSARKFWKPYTVLHYKSLKSLINGNNNLYGNASFTRFYMDFKDKTLETIIKKRNTIKMLWESRDIVIIEGEYTRCGVGNDLFDNVSSLSRILCPSVNAFFKYDEIIHRIHEIIPKNKDILILCCLGPTATCLAYDLCVEGYQTIDLGHLDVEYEWALHGYKEKKKLYGKAVNEMGYNVVYEEFLDEKYNSEIIATII